MTNLAQKFKKTIITSEKTRLSIAKSISNEIVTDAKKQREILDTAKKLGVLKLLKLPIGDNEFENILSQLKTDEESEIDHFSISIDNGTYSIVFMCQKDNEYTLEVNEAVKKVSNKWVNLKFSEAQLKVIDDRMNEVYKEIEEREKWLAYEEMKSIKDSEDIMRDNLWEQATGAFY